MPGVSEQLAALRRMSKLEPQKFFTTAFTCVDCVIAKGSGPEYLLEKINQLLGPTAASPSVHQRSLTTPVHLWLFPCVSVLGAALLHQNYLPSNPRKPLDCSSK
jgi:hypothetical protein